MRTFISRLFYQNAIGLFNASNPDGGVTEHVLWISVLVSAVLLGAVCVLETTLVRPKAVTSLCRVDLVFSSSRMYDRLGLQLGKRAYKAYGEKLATTMDKMLLVSEVAALSRKRTTWDVRRRVYFGS